MALEVEVTQTLPFNPIAISNEKNSPSNSRTTQEGESHSLTANEEQEKMKPPGSKPSPSAFPLALTQDSSGSISREHFATRQYTTAPGFKSGRFLRDDPSNEKPSNIPTLELPISIQKLSPCRSFTIPITKSSKKGIYYKKTNSLH